MADEDKLNASLLAKEQELKLLAEKINQRELELARKELLSYGYDTEYQVKAINSVDIINAFIIDRRARKNADDKKKADEEKKKKEEEEKKKKEKEQNEDPESEDPEKDKKKFPPKKDDEKQNSGISLSGNSGYFLPSTDENAEKPHINNSVGMNGLIQGAEFINSRAVTPKICLNDQAGIHRLLIEFDKKTGLPLWIA